jgi:hypothetical protein
MVKSCVFFAVRTELLTIIWKSFGFKGENKTVLGTKKTEKYCKE